MAKKRDKKKESNLAISKCPFSPEVVELFEKHIGYKKFLSRKFSFLHACLDQLCLF